MHEQDFTVAVPWLILIHRLGCTSPHGRHVVANQGQKLVMHLTGLGIRSAVEQGTEPQQKDGIMEGACVWFVWIACRYVPLI